MSALLDAAGSLPTAVWTTLLIPCLLYWMAVIVGGLGFHGGHADAGADGHDAGIGGDGHHGFLEFLSIGRVPVTITLSAIILIGWTLSLAGDLALRSLLGDALVPLLVGPGSFAAGLIGGAYAVRPLRSLFDDDAQHAHASLVGREVRVTSLTVDARFGTAVHETTGPDVLLNVVCRGGVSLAKDERAVVVDWLPERGVYLVGPLPHLRPGFAEHGLSAVPPAPPSGALVSPTSAPPGPTAAAPARAAEGGHQS